MQPKIKKISENIRQIYRKINTRTGGWIGIVRHAFNQFNGARGIESATSLAFRALFSIFPMLIFIISVTSHFLKREIVQEKILNAITDIIPAAEQVINNNIKGVLQLRGTIGTLALVALIWSASSVFNFIVTAVNRAFPGGKHHNFFHSRLIAFLIVLTLGLLFALSLATTTLTELIPAFTIPLRGKTIDQTFLWQILSIIVPFLIKFFLFWAIYQWIPRVHVEKKAALISALFTSIAWELITNGFTWYLGSGFATFQLIYGSLGAIIALLFWVYLTGWITIFGAHLTYAIDYHITHKISETEIFADALHGTE